MPAGQSRRIPDSWSGLSRKTWHEILADPWACQLRLRVSSIAVDFLQNRFDCLFGGPDVEKIALLNRLAKIAIFRPLVVHRDRENCLSARMRAGY